MSDRVEALLGLHARQIYTYNQLITALTLAGVADPVAALTAPTLVDLPRTVHIEPSPLLRRRWQPMPLDMQDDVRAWGVGTQL